MKKIIIIIGILFTMTNMTQANQEIIVHENFIITPDMEMLIDHSFYEGVKIKSIKIKQVEIEHDTIIKNGKVNEGEPNSISVLIEITDMKGNKNEIFGSRPLEVGDYKFIIEETVKK